MVGLYLNDCGENVKKVCGEIGVTAYFCPSIGVFIETPLIFLVVFFVAKKCGIGSHRSRERSRNQTGYTRF